MDAFNTGCFSLTHSFGNKWSLAIAPSNDVPWSCILDPSAEGDPARLTCHILFQYFGLGDFQVTKTSCFVNCILP